MSNIKIEIPKLTVLILIIICIALGMFLQFSGWFSHTRTLGKDEITITKTTYFLTQYNSVILVYNKEEGEKKGKKTFTTSTYASQEFACKLCGTNQWCHCQCGLYHILTPHMYTLNIFIIIFLFINLFLVGFFICFKKIGFDNKKIFTCMHFCIILSMLGTGAMMFIFDIITCSKWTKLKDSQPDLVYEDNSIIIPIIGFMYGTILLIIGAIFSYDYHKYRQPKDILNTRRESFL